MMMTSIPTNTNTKIGELLRSIIIKYLTEKLKKLPIFVI